jgi:(p)ppGpp synthase/HD superfamily hydrolase
MTPEQVKNEIAHMKALIAQQKKRQSVSNIESKPMPKQALAFARLAHADQIRKYDGSPYIDHPIEVANILIRHGITDERTLTVALLHDVVEDTTVPIEEIGVQFNHQIQRDVAALTKPRNIKGREARIRTAAANVIVAGPTAMLVKIADIISNIQDVALHDPGFAGVYLAEKKETLRAFGESSTGRTHTKVRELLTTAYDAHGEAMNQLALTVLAEENQRIADEAETKAEIEAIMSQQALDEMAEIALF